MAPVACPLALLLLLAPGVEATTLGNRLAVRRAAAAQGWWPFDGTSAPAAKPAATKKTEVQSIQSIKDGIMLSAAFGHKTEEICAEAAPEDMKTCRALAGARVFCALLKRRSVDSIEALAGGKEEMESCKNINIMDNAPEAAKDERIQREAQED
mmetsp:Transcript_67245/g.187638  ORF Transcript_67245/g.187638 Transcript_67245/m.187638 type:complete len:154 (-) Transcript_67245:119-580(-)